MWQRCLSGAAAASCMWIPRGSGTVGFSLAPGQQLAVEHAAEGGRAAGPVQRGCVLQVHQVVVRLAHPRLLALVPPAEEQLGALL